MSSPVDVEPQTPLGQNILRRSARVESPQAGAELAVHVGQIIRDAANDDLFASRIEHEPISIIFTEPRLQLAE